MEETAGCRVGGYQRFAHISAHRARPHFVPRERHAGAQRAASVASYRGVYELSELPTYSFHSLYESAEVTAYRTCLILLKDEQSLNNGVTLSGLLKCNNTHSYRKLQPSKELTCYD